jgi:serine/threonine-protein kinase
VAWALAKDPASRFSSVYAMAHALKPFASPEGQVLIDRIGRLAHTKDSPRKPPPQISPTSPLSRRTGSEPPPARAPEQTMLMAPGYDESEYEQTRYFGEDPFGPPPSSRRGSAPPSSRGSVPPPPGSHPGGSGSWSALALDPDPLGSPYSTAGNTGGWPAPTAVGQQQSKRQHKAAVIAFGASLLLLPALVMVLVVTLRGQVGFSAPSPVAQSETKEAPSTPGKLDPGEAAPATSGESPSELPGEGSPSPSKQSARADGNARFPVPPPKGGRFPPPPPPPRVAKAAPPPEVEEPEPDDSEGGGGEMGTLVAIAIGGDCAFAVDGASHGTRSSIRVKVPVGPHTVSCSPKGKSSRSQRVNVKAGKPGMATFRLN